MTAVQRLYAGVVVLLAALAAVVVLKVTHNDAGDIIAWITPIISTFVVVDQLNAQNKTLDTIHTNTNGVLDKRIEAGVAAALKARDEAQAEREQV